MNINDLIGKVTQADCLDILRELPDKCVDLCLTDPPYGIPDKLIRLGKDRNAGNKFSLLYQQKGWDKRPQGDSFKEIMRVSKNQIVCGGNYFSQYLPVSSEWIVWDKECDGMTSVNPELIWTSFNKSIQIFRRGHGLDKGFMVKDGFGGVHPTQKPVALMTWILERYSKPTDIVLDAYLGSGTTAVACERLGRRWIGIELDKDYCEIARKRIADEREKYEAFDALEKQETFLEA